MLSGGGARGAYQAGALRAVAELWGGPPITVITGSSIGALNGAVLAEGLQTDGLQGAAGRLEQAWRNLDGLLRLNWRSLACAAWRALRSGPRVDALRAVRSLLDDRPVIRAMGRLIPPGRRMGDYRRVELVVTATDLNSGRTVTFDRSTPDVPVLAAVLASAAYPVAFPSRQVRGRWHVDGGVFDNAPLGHAIRRGVDAVLVVATSPGCGASGPAEAEGPFADVYAVLRRLWPLMLDRLLYDDLREALRVNEAVELLAQAEAMGIPDGAWLRRLRRLLGETASGRVKRRVDIVMICPRQELDPPGTFGFHDRRALRAALTAGYQDARATLAGARPAP